MHARGAATETDRLSDQIVSWRVHRKQARTGPNPPRCTAFGAVTVKTLACVSDSRIRLTVGEKNRILSLQVVYFIVYL